MPEPSQTNDTFQAMLYTVLQQVPAGKLITYGKLATLAGRPNGARQVGQLLKRLPKDTKLPWHRVVNAQRKCSFPEASNAYKRQLDRLADEDVVLINGRFDKAYFI